MPSALPNTLKLAGGGFLHYVIGRPVSSHSLDESVVAVALRDLPAIVSGNPPA